MTKNFKKERERLNRIVMKYARLGIKRLYSLDTLVYQKGALSKKTKEMLGLASSLVLRCDDCIHYHIARCYEEGVTDEELEETLAIAAVIGGTITIPHLRRALNIWDGMRSKNKGRRMQKGK
ncbi:MAG TPA: carboxymuconolactone decarboxylase family protein [bacterium]